MGDQKNLLCTDFWLFHINVIMWLCGYYVY